VRGHHLPVPCSRRDSSPEFLVPTLPRERPCHGVRPPHLAHQRRPQQRDQRRSERSEDHSHATAAHLDHSNATATSCCTVPYNAAQISPVSVRIYMQRQRLLCHSIVGRHSNYSGIACSLSLGFAGVVGPWVRRCRRLRLRAGNCQHVQTSSSPRRTPSAWPATCWCCRAR
jgi:hypothetical protein